MDALLEICRTMQLSGAIFLEAEFSAPWCVTSKVAPEDCTPFMPLPAHVVGYHYVTAGRLQLLMADQPPVSVEAGEFIVLPRNDKHVLASAMSLEPVEADMLIQPGQAGGLTRIVHGGGGECTQIFCGFLGTNASNMPILSLLPKVLKIGVEQGIENNWIESSFRFAARQLARGQLESPSMLAKLAEVLFMEAVRRYASSLTLGAGRWLDGLRDPVIGHSLALLHRETSHRWTTEELARAVGLSRSAFAERFTHLIGEPPMRYLANWRLQAAAQRLKESNEPVSRIAFETGYESEAAFNRAFKRAFDAPPMTWRKRQSEP